MRYDAFRIRYDTVQRDKLLPSHLKKRATVTDVTATIITSHVANSKRTKLVLERHSTQTLRAVIGTALGDHTIQSKKVEQTCEVSQVGFRRRLLAYAQFWQRMMDQNITLVIFAVLSVLTVLPILQLPDKTSR